MGKGVLVRMFTKKACIYQDNVLSLFFNRELRKFNISSHFLHQDQYMQGAVHVDTCSQCNYSVPQKSAYGANNLKL